MSHPALTPDRFELRILPDRERVIVEVSGELDMATVDAVTSAVHGLRDADWQHVIVDLEGCTFIDVQGLRMLLAIDAEARSDGWRFAIVDSAPPVSRLLEVTGMREHFVTANGH